ncbi:hypothetical protein [Oceanobacillus neutriphilus]|uniref:Aminoglycoside phosphotransferase domain-containing protein n=1 Tax=Oceanobacillus neutriphilus TaxID=531815 RepID=A0ABQ2NZ60_9BACI|nr:hypothetical protein [Oceanobacillus neutriphilus]GGP14205.1 hypothetical protein GCM10011346_37330 [Oceanobacillus neutriphilus]
MVNIREIITSNYLHAESYKELKARYSSAKKYKLYASENNPAYLLKIYDIWKKDRVKHEFELLNKHYQNKVLCQKAKLFGYSEKEQICYLILPYIKGKSGDAALPELGEHSQYKIGLQAGRELRKIHLLTPDSTFNW